MDKTKLLIIIPSLVGGGAERALINFLRMLDYSRFEVDLCVALKKGIHFCDVPPYINIIILFHNVLIDKLLTKFHIYFNINRFYRWIANRKIKGQYDVGISFLDSSYTDILFFLNNKVRRKISWVHSSYKSNIDFNKFYHGRYKSRIIKNRYCKLDTIVFVSNDSREEFQEVFGSFPHMTVVYNISAIDSVIEKSKESVTEIFDRSIINVVALGFLHPVKGYSNLIHAAELLKKDGLRFKIRILGDGLLKVKLQNLIKKLKVMDVIELKGYLSNPYPFLKASDIFVMTSFSEALPIALVEAMVLGLPTVVTNCSGCREIIDHGKFGLMTEPTAIAIYEGLKDLIIDKDKRLYYRNKSLTRAKIFDDNEILKQIYNIIAC